MPRFPRLVVPGYPHHVTQRGVRRQTTFFDNSDYLAYLRIATEVLDRVDVSIWAYCLMPNHIHAVVIPGAEDSLAQFFASLHRRYAKRTNNKYDWRGHLWQERFYSVVMDEQHLVAAMRYVELNPVRAGICKAPQDWPWSSTRGNLDLALDPLIDRRGTKEVIHDWRDYLGTSDDDERSDQLRQQTLTGRPDGSAEFLRNLEAITGRRVRRMPAGRKQKTG